LEYGKTDKAWEGGQRKRGISGTRFIDITEVSERREATEEMFKD
jgi:hypothetical protein